MENEGFLELYDLTTKTVVSTVPLTHLKFLPRAGERVLIRLPAPEIGDPTKYWISNIS